MGSLWSSALKVFKNLFLLLALAFLLLKANAQQELTGRVKVVIVASYHPTNLWTQDQLSGMLGVLEERFDPMVDIRVEFMNAEVPRSEKYFHHFHERLREGYAASPPELLFTLDNIAFEYAKGIGRELFKQTPIVFCGLNDFEPEWLEGESLITGITEEGLRMADSVRLGTELFPETKQVLIVSQRDGEVNYFRETFEGPQNWRRFDTTKSGGWAEVFRQIGQVEEPSIIYLDTFVVDDEGRRWDYRDLIHRFKATGFPVFVSGRRYMGAGALGGKITSGTRYGARAARLGLRVVNGEAPSAIPIEKGISTETQFDYNEMVAFGLDLADVPQDAVILNQPNGLYRKYKHYLIGALAFIVVQMSLIGLLLANVRKRKAVQVSLVKAKEEAEAGSKAKFEFLAIMSHELRTPLNAVLGFAQIMDLEESKKERSHYAELIRSNGTHLIHLIDNLLNYTYYSRGQISLELKVCEIRLELEHLIESFQVQAAEKQIRLEFSCGYLLRQVMIDWSKTREVISNLIDNAIKFSEQGRVLCEASIVKNAGSDMMFFCSVSDTGVGIPPELHSCIFDPFYQRDGSDTRSHSGVGLGLAICSRLVEGMDGEISCHTQQSGGTRFDLSVPVKAVAKEGGAI